jgi:hypothetical protein
VHPPPQFGFEGCQLGPHPIPASLPLALEAAGTGTPTDMFETQKVGRPLFAESWPDARPGRITAEKAVSDSPREILNNQVFGTTWIAVLERQAGPELVRYAPTVMIKVIPFSFISDAAQ